MRTAFALGMLFDFPHVTAVFVDHPHPGKRPDHCGPAAEGDGLSSNDGKWDDSHFLLNNAALRFAGRQQQTAMDLLEEIVENLPVVERRPVAFRNLNADQFAAVAGSHLGTVSDPLIRDAVNLTSAPEGLES